MRLLFNCVVADRSGRSPRLRCAIERLIHIPLFWMRLVALCVVASTVGTAAGEGVITGHVVIAKALTKKRVTLPTYQLRGVTLGAQDAEKREYGEPDADELLRVVVYLEGSGLNPGAPAKATLSQKNRHFDPEIVVVPVGSTVSFPNLDAIFHNVFSLSKVKQFDLGFFPLGETRAVKFDRPGIVQVYCHLHSDMSAAIVVLPTGSWTQPAPNGTFSLSSVPPGAYDLVAWHRSAGFFRRHLTVSSGETAAVDFVIPVRDLDSSIASGASGER